jgi:zinc transporter 9
MEGFGQLLVFSLVMLFGSYGAGSLPLFMSMSEKNLHLVSVLGAGLLLGVALAVIIPEGLQTLIKAYSTSPSELGINVGL